MIQKEEEGGTVVLKFQPTHLLPKMMIHQGGEEDPLNDLRDMKFDPHEFEGSLHPNLYLEWMQSFERFLDIKEYSKEKAFKVVVLKLKKYASVWYENTKRLRTKDGKSQIKTWSKLKRLMPKQFLPNTYKHDLYLRVSSFQQGRMSVEKYIRELE